MLRIITIGVLQFPKGVWREWEVPGVVFGALAAKSKHHRWKPFRACSFFGP